MEPTYCAVGSLGLVAYRLHYSDMPTDHQEGGGEGSGEGSGCTGVQPYDEAGIANSLVPTALQGC